MKVIAYCKQNTEVLQWLHDLSNENTNCSRKGNHEHSTNLLVFMNKVTMTQKVWMKTRIGVSCKLLSCLYLHIAIYMQYI